MTKLTAIKYPDGNFVYRAGGLRGLSPTNDDNLHDICTFRDRASAERAIKSAITSQEKCLVARKERRDGPGGGEWVDRFIKETEHDIATLKSLTIVEFELDLS